MSRLRRFLAHTNPSAATAEAPIPETETVESDLVVILAALLCALICVVGLIAVARCAWLRRSSSGATGYPAQASANKGLKKKVLRSIPKLTYSSGTFSGPKFASECAICLAEFAEGDELRVLPQCGHGFHVGCIDTWLGSHSSCPSCRQILAVGRCNKCGEFPSLSGSGVGTEAESKTIEETTSSTSNIV